MRCLILKMALLRLKSAMPSGPWAVPISFGTILGPSTRPFSVWYHPKASPGPSDSQFLFQRFFDLIERRV